MNSSRHQPDDRQRSYAYFLLSVLETLREAVSFRESEGELRSQIAARIDMDRSQLSRTLNGRVKNITIKTISDILYATGHSPKELEAEPWERLSQQWTRAGCLNGDENIIVVPESVLISVTKDLTHQIPRVPSKVDIGPILTSTVFQ